AAGAQLALERVAVSHGFLQAMKRIGHEGKIWSDWGRGEWLRVRGLVRSEQLVEHALRSIQERLGDLVVLCVEVSDLRQLLLRKEVDGVVADRLPRHRA